MSSQRGLSYVAPKRMQTNEKARPERLLQCGQDRYEADKSTPEGTNVTSRRRSAGRRRTPTPSENFGLRFFTSRVCPTRFGERLVCSCKWNNGEYGIAGDADSTLTF